MIIWLVGSSSPFSLCCVPISNLLNSAIKPSLTPLLLTTTWQHGRDSLRGKECSIPLSMLKKVVNVSNWCCCCCCCDCCCCCCCCCCCRCFNGLSVAFREQWINGLFRYKMLNDRERKKCDFVSLLSLFLLSLSPLSLSLSLHKRGGQVHNHQFLFWALTITCFWKLEKNASRKVLQNLISFWVTLYIAP